MPDYQKSDATVYKVFTQSRFVHIFALEVGHISHHRPGSANMFGAFIHNYVHVSKIYVVNNLLSCNVSSSK